ncbi:hypothetical protein Pelo_1319 [Pelomyxa schiedti]|nr:hypothetical protein Pelo_1319 [Pelomyxa schiedti]
MAFLFCVASIILLSYNYLKSVDVWLIFRQPASVPDESAPILEAEKHSTDSESKPSDSETLPKQDPVEEAPSEEKSAESPPVSESPKEIPAANSVQQHISPNAPSKSTPVRSARLKLYGVLAAFSVGVISGSTMAPLAMAQEYSPVQGISYAVSYGIGFFVLSLLFALVYFTGVCVWKRKVEVPPLHIKVAVIPASLAGVIWNAGNILAMLASLSPLGMSQGFTLTQLCIVVSALWGILWYREVTGIRNLLIFTVATLILAAGALLLGYFG